MNKLEVRAQYIRILLDKVRQDRHPSATHMSLIEQALPAEWIPDYLEILFEKVADDTYPSIPMLNRISRLVDSVP